MNHRLVRPLFFTMILLPNLTACTSAASAPWQWQRVEAGLPYQTIVQAVAANPRDPDQVWVGSYVSGGLAASGDGGQSWTTSGTDTPGLADNPVFDLLATVSHGQTILWAAVRDGLLKSVDLGQSWQRITEDLPPATAFALAADGRGRLYVGLDDAGVYAQTRDGQGWESVTTSESLYSAAVLSLDVSADGAEIYAGTAAQGVFASRDGGQTWVNTYPDRYAPNVALNPLNPLVAVAALRDRLVRTLDGGQSWHTLPVSWANHEITALVWLADGTLGAGTGRGQVYRSVDDGDSWLEGGNGLPASRAVLALAVAETGAHASDEPSRFLAGTWTGLYASDDGGQTWRQLAPSLGVPHARALLTTHDGLLLGTQGGLFRWQSDTQRWVSTADEFLQEGVAALALAPSDHQTLYAGTIDTGVYRSDDGGMSWQPLPSLSVGIPALAVDPTDAEHVYMLASWERVYESRNGGQNWLARWEGLGITIEAASLAVDPLRFSVYLGGDTGLFRSLNGEDWDWVGPSLADQSILALMVQPIPDILGGGSILYIGTTRGAFRTLDGGQTVQGSEPKLGWGRGLEDISVTAFLADPADPQKLYAGTAYSGVYQSLDWGHTWQPIGPPELTGELVESMAWGPEGALFVAASGGVWRGIER